MTTQTPQNDALLSLWALEQNLYRNEDKNEPVMCLFSGGQDSSALAWFLYHTEPASLPSRQSLLHYVHLLQPDNIFMAQHAVNLSFWLGWRHTSVFPTQTFLSEKEASCWRAALRHRIGVNLKTWIPVNGHTETDKREADFFKVMRTPEHGDIIATDYACPMYNTLPLSYMLADFNNTHSGDANDVRRPLLLLTRDETRLLVAAQRLPIYPDQTNFECHTTRAQVRYLVFPLLAKLGFTFFE